MCVYAPCTINTCTCHQTAKHNQYEVCNHVCLHMYVLQCVLNCLTHKFAKIVWPNKHMICMHWACRNAQRHCHSQSTQMWRSRRVCTWSSWHKSYNKEAHIARHNTCLPSHAQEQHATWSLAWHQSCNKSVQWCGTKKWLSLSYDVVQKNVEQASKLLWHWAVQSALSFVTSKSTICTGADWSTIIGCTPLLMSLQWFSVFICW